MDIDLRRESYTAAEWRYLSDVYRQADRSTAYWMQDKYNDADCRRAWAFWFSAIDTIQRDKS